MRTYLQEASERFGAVFGRLETVVLRRFPGAVSAFEWRMPGWKVPRPPSPVPAHHKGTLDSRYIFILLVERKSAFTLHFWNPADYTGLERRKQELTRAGFRVMRGCLRFERRSEFPVEAVDQLLQGV